MVVNCTKWNTSEACVKQNNCLICKYGREIESIATATTKITTTIMTVPFGSFLRTLNGHSSAITSLTVLQNGDLASVSWDLTIKIWSPIDTLKRTLNGHTNRVFAL